jgi:hypothetical protein
VAAASLVDWVVRKSWFRYFGPGPLESSALKRADHIDHEGPSKDGAPPRDTEPSSPPDFAPEDAPIIWKLRPLPQLRSGCA